MDPTDESCAGDDRVLIHYSLLQVSFDLAQESPVRDATEHTDGVGTVQIRLAVHVLHKGAGDDDDLDRRARDLDP